MVYTQAYKRWIRRSVGQSPNLTDKNGGNWLCGRTESWSSRVTVGGRVVSGGKAVDGGCQPAPDVRLEAKIWMPVVPFGTPFIPEPLHAKA